MENENITPLSPNLGKTMSSLVIAEITGKPHNDVLKDIRRILGEAEIGVGEFSSSYRNSQNKKQPCFLLPRRECDLVISGYSVKYRLAIIDRWQELECNQAFQIPASFAEALRLAADQAEMISSQREQLQIAAPKIEFYDAVADSNTVCQMAVACQVAQLSFGRNTLYQKLRQLGVLISGGDRHNLPKQQFIKQGLFTVKESKIPHPEHDEPIVSFTTHVTQKGIAWLIKTFGTQGGQPA